MEDCILGSMGMDNLKLRVENAIHYMEKDAPLLKTRLCHEIDGSSYVITIQRGTLEIDGIIEE